MEICGLFLSTAGLTAEEEPKQQQSWMRNCTACSNEGRGSSSWSAGTSMESSSWLVIVHVMFAPANRAAIISDVDGGWQ